MRNPSPNIKFKLARMNFKRKPRLSVNEYKNGILSGDHIILGRALTLVESHLEEDNRIAETLIEEILPHTGNSIRIGVTGVPGVGKSTFIETLGIALTSEDNKIAVLAIDPSSRKSGGSIMGDKTRMEKLSLDQNAFIRPSPSGITLGGVAAKTREDMLLCEAAGFEIIFVETVGVGQAEDVVKEMVDCFLLLMLSGAGDELQGMKKGIMEMADVIAITKSDGDNKKQAEQAKSQFQMALNLFPPSESGWIPEIMTCSALENTGIKDVWEHILKYLEYVKSNGYFEQNRKNQKIKWMHAAIRNSLYSSFFDNKTLKDEVSKMEGKVLQGDIAPINAARELFKLYKK